MVSVIFPAAGQGKRMQTDVNKVLLNLAGVPMLVHTLQRFSNCAAVDELIIVAAADEILFLQQMLDKVSGLKSFKIVVGGAERQFSVENALKAVRDDANIILVHDAARPLISSSVIEAVIDAARQGGAAIAAVRAKNTIKFIDNDGIVQSTPERSGLWEIQTPQGFQRDILLAAYHKARQDGFVGTDDASLVERLGIAVRVIESDYRNIKVTTPEDLLFVEAILQQDVALKKTRDT